MGLLCVVIVVVSWLNRRGLLSGPALGGDVATAPIAAALSVGAGAIHVAVTADHFAEFWLYGVLFLVVAAFQLAWGVAYLRRPRPVIALIGATVSLAIVGVWLWSRTAGLPVGPSPGESEHVGFIDFVATVFEVLLAAVLVLRLRAGTAVADDRARVSAMDATIARTFSILSVAIVCAFAIATNGGQP